MGRRKKPSPPPTGPDPTRFYYLAGGAALLWVILTLLAPAPRERGKLERNPPAEKRLRFDFRPPGLPGAYVAIVAEEGSQTVHLPGEVVTLEAAGTIQWTAHAQGFGTVSGKLELPYGEDSVDVRVIEVTMPAPGRAPRRAPPR